MANKRLLKWITAGCGVVLALVMFLAVALNQREAAAFATNGVRADAVVEEKYVRTEFETGVEAKHRCLRVTIRTLGSGEASGSSCDRGIDRIFESTQVGATVRVVYLEKDLVRESRGRASVLDFVLEDWADRR